MCTRQYFCQAVLSVARIYVVVDAVVPKPFRARLVKKMVDDEAGRLSCVPSASIFFLRGVRNVRIKHDAIMRVIALTRLRRYPTDYVLFRITT